MFYVYEHWLDGKCFYVGKGSESTGRAYQLDTNRSEKWMDYCKGNESNILIKIVKYFDDETEAYSYERILSLQRRSEGQPLTGRYDGQSAYGERNGFYGKSHSEKTKKQISKNQKDFSGERNGMYGRKHSNKSREKMSKNNGMNGQPSPTRRKSKLIMNDGEEIEFTYNGEAYQYFKENFGLSSGKVKELLKTGLPYKTHYSKYKHLEGMRMEYIK